MLDESRAMCSVISSEVADGGGLLVTLKPSTSIIVRSTDVSVDPAMLSSKGSFGVRLLAGEFRKSLGSLLTPKSASLVTPPSIEKYDAAAGVPPVNRWLPWLVYRTRDKPEAPGTRPIA